MTSESDFAIDELAGLLPLAARDRLAESLTLAEIETLTHLAKTGTGPNSLRALASDLAYLEAWSRASTAAPLAWPAPETAVLRFVAHHLWDEAERAKNPDHGMPDAVADVLRAEGRLRARRSARTGHGAAPPRALGDAASLARPRRALRRSRHPQRVASFDPRRRPPARAKERLVRSPATFSTSCSRPAGGEGRSIFATARCCLLAFGSGGRRRSEIVRLRSTISKSASWFRPILRRRKGRTLPVLAVRLRRTKTSSADAGESALMVGRPVDALRAWLEFSNIDSGPVFRRIDKWGQIGLTALDPQSVNGIIKSRSAAAGLDPAQYSAARAALRLSHPGRARRGFASRGHAAVAAPVRAAGVALLQRGADRTGQGRAVGIEEVSARRGFRRSSMADEDRLPDTRLKLDLKSAALVRRFPRPITLLYRTRFGTPAILGVSFAFIGWTARENPIQASDFRFSTADWPRALSESRNLGDSTVRAAGACIILGFRFTFHGIKRAEICGTEWGLDVAAPECRSVVVERITRNLQAAQKGGGNENFGGTGENRRASIVCSCFSAGVRLEKR